MRRRNLALALVLTAALAGSACLRSRSITDATGGLPPDTLALSIGDSTLSFSIETSVVHSGDTLQVFFTIRNNGTTNRSIQGSSSCTFTVRAFTLAGAQVSPSAQRACTADLVTYAMLTPGEVITIAHKWRVDDGSSGGAGPTLLPSGVYEIEAFLDAVNFQRTSRRLKIQVVKR